MVWLWLVVALCAAILEIVASGLVFVGLAGAALAAALISVFVPGLVPQAIAFAAVTFVYLFGLRRIAIRMLGETHFRLSSHGSHTALMGRRAIATEEITPDGGQIRLGQGEFWSARSYDGQDIIPEGTRVEIVFVDGLTAMVERRALLAESKAMNDPAQLPSDH